jgi:hypothetical protein
MRMRPNLVAGVAAAALALTACGVAVGTSGGTQGGHAASVSVRHAPTDTRYSEMRELAKVKREVSWKAVDPAGVRQPQLDTRYSEMRELAKVKRETSWKAAEHAWGR